MLIGINIVLLNLDITLIVRLKLNESMVFS